MTPVQFSQAIEILSSDAPPRVWSLIVTAFGDLARGAGETIPGPLLTELLAPLGIRPEAMRVALHRLRNEGWIATQKSGRTSLHRLSPFGLEQSAEASRVIYRRENPCQDDWHLLLFQPISAPEELTRQTSLSQDGYIGLAPGLYLANAPAPERPLDDALVLGGTLQAMPAWITQQITPAGVISGFKDLSATLDILIAELNETTSADALHRACLRTMIVHRWRRLILRAPDVPDCLFGQDGALPACRARVIEALDRLPRPDLSALN